MAHCFQGLPVPLRQQAIRLSLLCPFEQIGNENQQCKENRLEQQDAGSEEDKTRMIRLSARRLRFQNLEAYCEEG
jgi:hypothetical protein